MGLHLHLGRPAGHEGDGALLVGIIRQLGRVDRPRAALAPREQIRAGLALDRPAGEHVAGPHGLWQSHEPRVRGKRHGRLGPLGPGARLAATGLRAEVVGDADAGLLLPLGAERRARGALPGAEERLAARAVDELAALGGVGPPQEGEARARRQGIGDGGQRLAERGPQLARAAGAAVGVEGQRVGQRLPLGVQGQVRRNRGRLASRLAGQLAALGGREPAQAAVPLAGGHRGGHGLAVRGRARRGVDLASVGVPGHAPSEDGVDGVGGGHRRPHGEEHAPIGIARPAHERPCRGPRVPGVLARKALDTFPMEVFGELEP